MKLILFVEEDVIDLAKFDQLSFVDSPDGTVKVLYATALGGETPVDHAVAVLGASTFVNVKDAIQQALKNGGLTVDVLGRRASQEVMEAIGYRSGASKAAGEYPEPERIVARFLEGDSALPELQKLVGRRVASVTQNNKTIAVITEGE